MGLRQASTEPHSCECGEAARATPVTPAARALQRSRTRVSAESPRVKRAADCLGLASTEPHSCECGEAPARRQGEHRSPGFNGAALV